VLARQWAAVIDRAFGCLVKERAIKAVLEDRAGRGDGASLDKDAASAGRIITPLIQQQQVSLPPAMIISMQLLIGALFGVIGLALATAIAALGQLWSGKRMSTSKRRH
jgi:hypothetical protein